MGLKTKLAMAFVSSAAGAAMIAGGTFAMFTTAAQNDSNTFTAGKITLDITDNSVGKIWGTTKSFGPLAPGDSQSNFQDVTLKNNGTIAEWVKISATETGTKDVQNIFQNATTDDNATGTAGTGDQNPLTVSYKVTIGGTDASNNNASYTATEYAETESTWNSTTNTAADVIVPNLVPNATLAAGNSLNVDNSGQSDVKYILLPPGATAEIQYSYNFPRTAGNDYQSAGGTLSLSFSSVQARNNTDSAGDAPQSMS